MSRSSKLFGWVVGLGTVPYLVFAVLAILQPDFLSVVLGIEWVEFSYVWIANLGMLCVTWIAFSFPLAGKPDRYRFFAWAFTLGHLLLAAYWGVQLFSPEKQVFLAFFVVDAALFALQALLLFFAPAELRPTPENIRAELAAIKESRKGENRYWTWFRRVTLLGIATNLVGFCIPALFAPDSLARQLGAGQTAFSHVWLGAVSLVLATVTLMYVPSALGPARYPVYPWVMAFGRLTMGVFWFGVYRTPYQEGYLLNFVSDFGYGVILLGLLLAAYRADKHPVWSAMAEVTPKLATVGTVVAIALMGGMAVGSSVRPATPNVQDDTPLNHFKYGAIGMNPSAQVPYYLWLVLPRMFPEKLPQGGSGTGWEKFGFLYEAGKDPAKDTPVGFAQRDVGFPVLEPNCSLCHTGSVRAAPDQPRTLLPGAPAGMLDLQAFQWFLYEAASDPRFTPENVVAEIEKVVPLSARERLTYRYVVIPMAKQSLLNQMKLYEWQRARPVQGRGRTDTFNPTKLSVFHLPDDGTIGTTDLPQIWNQELRRNLWLHWDGNNNSLTERNLAAAMAVGATPRSVILPSFQRVFDFALELQPPAYPFTVDQAKAAAGKTVYEANCAGCHAFGAPNVGQVTPIAEIGTDRHRLDSFSQELVDTFHLIEEYPFKFDAYRKTQGYTNTPLDGVWARGPYLHHGAVPTLWDLLQPPQNRPTLFWRGYDVYDPVKVGFVSTGPAAEREGWRYDTSVKGNANTGHLYGTTLSDEEKWALLEYMKTL